MVALFLGHQGMTPAGQRLGSWRQSLTRWIGTKEPRTVTTTLLQCGFVLLYLGVLLWFARVDVYHMHFFGTGYRNLGYALARVLFVAYVGWCQFYLGKQLLSFWQRRQAGLKLSVLDEYLVCFYVGGAILAGITFVLGMLHLYYYRPLAVASVILVALSSAEFVRTGGVWWRTARKVLLDRRDLVRLGSTWLALGCVLFLVVVLAEFKGMYPGGGGDYYTHYFPYFRHVLQSRGLWPNDVWYHFFVSKGATITITSMLLTDPLAPEMVTYLYFLVGTLCVWSLLRRCANNRIVPCLGMAVCLGAFLWTPNKQLGDWGMFQKHHEFTASLLLSVVWMTVVMPNAGGVARKAWMSFLALAVMHCILLSPTVFPLVFALLGLVLLAALLKRAWGVFASTAVAMTCAGLVFGGLLTLNYLWTGLAEVTPMRLFWKHANQERFSRWVSPYLMVLLLEGSSPDMGDVRLVEHKEGSRAEYLRTLVRTQTVRCFFPDIDEDVPASVLLVLLGVTVPLAFGKKVRFELWRLAVPVAGLFVLALVLSQLVTQPVSVYRYFSFMVFLIVLLALGLWVLLFRLHPNRKLVRLTSCVVPALLTCLVTYQSVLAIPEQEREDLWRFATGKESLGEAFLKRGITSWVPLTIRDLTGPGKRVYSFNINNYCMAPDCELESFVSFALHQDWHEVLFEEPEQARAALQKQGLNYFLIDLNRDMVDVLQYSPLFRPENVGKYLEVRWHRGSTYLLTWPGPDTEPLPEEFLTIWSLMEFWNPCDLGPLYEVVRTIYKQNKGKPFPIVRDPSLPHPPGWQ